MGSDEKTKQRMRTCPCFISSFIASAIISLWTSGAGGAAGTPSSDIVVLTDGVMGLAKGLDGRWMARRLLLCWACGGLAAFPEEGHGR